MNFGFNKFEENDKPSVQKQYDGADTRTSKSNENAVHMGNERDLTHLKQRLKARSALLIILAIAVLTTSIIASYSLVAGLLMVIPFALLSLFLPRRGLDADLTPHIVPNNTHSNATGDIQETVTNTVQTIVDSLPDPVVLLTEKGSVVHFNSQAEDLLGELETGLHVSTAVRNPEFLEAISHARHSARPLTVHFTGRVPVERHISTVIAKIAFASESSEAPKLIAIFKDLTQLERINEMRADFIANASHELRTPLASLTGFIETLQGPAKHDPDARDRFLKIMAKQTRRMTRLIKDLLSLSRVEMTAHLQPVERVDVNEALSYVVDTMEPIAREVKMSLTLEALDGPAYVRGDREELVQVFQNLIQNALKYGEKHGHVDIAIMREASSDGREKTLIVSVEDDGPGISPEHLPRLTERFYRVDVTSSRDKGGTGLGLAIVKHIVNRHRGELNISSVPGKGTIFRVSFAESAVDQTTL